MRATGAWWSARRRCSTSTSSPRAAIEPLTHPADLLLLGGTIVTQDAARTIVHDGGVAIAGGAIVAVGDAAAIARDWSAETRIDTSRGVVIPGLIDAHHHLTVDPLVRSTIPDGIGSDEAIFGWATPLHTHARAEDDELAATIEALACLRAGTTTVIEAGTVAHPHRVAAGLARAGIRAGIGGWGWDTPGLPFALPAADVLDRARALLDAFPPGGLIEAWVTLVGHDLASDALLGGAADLARARGAGLSFHISPSEADVHAFRARSGLRPIEHLDRLGVLGDHLLLAHAVWIDDAELALLLASRSAVAYCPWAYLRLAQGVSQVGRHADLIRRGGRIALGCDSANAGDLPDIHRAAALAVGLARDMTLDSAAITAATGLDLATIRGADAIGMAARIGSIEIGKRADIVVHDTRTAAWRPPGRPDLNLIWGTDGRTVRDVIVDGRIVLRDGRSTLVDEDALADEAIAARRRLLRDAGRG